MPTFIVNTHQSSVLKAALVLAAAFSLSSCGQTGESSSSELATQGIISAGLSQDGHATTIGSILHGGSYWDLERGERLYNWNHRAGEQSQLAATAISADGKYSATANIQRTIVLWNTEDGSAKEFWEAPGDINRLALTAKAELAYLALKDNRSVLFDIQNGGVKSTLLHRDVVNAVAISAYGDQGVSGSDDYTTKHWDLASGRLLHSWDMGNKVQAVAISPDKRYIAASAQGGNALVWDAQTGEEYMSLNANFGMMQRGETYNTLQFTDKDDELLIGSTTGGVSLVNLKSKSVEQQWQLSKREYFKPSGVNVMALALDRKNNQVRAIGSNGMSYVLDR